MADQTFICVVGASGLIGVRHMQHCIDEPLVKLSCIVDPMPAGVELAKKHNVPHFNTVDDMLTAKEAGTVAVDGAILATPNHTHVPLGIQLVKAGIHALVEKPMSTDIPSGRELVAAAKATGFKVLVGHHRRFNPYVVAAKQQLVNGKLGKVLAVQGEWTVLKPPEYFAPPTSWRGESKSGGVILINLVHDMDLLCYLFGNVVKVYCEKGPVTRNNSVEETGAVILTFKSGTIGTFIFSDAVASPHNWEGATGENPTMPYTGQHVYTFFGTKGTMSVPELKVHHYAVDDDKGCWTDPFIVDPAPTIEDIPPFTLQLRHFVDVCKGKAEPNCSSLEALRAIILLETIKESMAKGVPVDVPQG